MSEKQTNTPINVEWNEFNAQTWKELKGLVRPVDDELRWLEIPWEADLSVAREKAKEEGRPIFMWAMNGDPLGCV